jgi:hypothetical protein
VSQAKENVVNDEFYYRCCGVIRKTSLKPGQRVKAMRDGELHVAEFSGLVCPQCEATMEYVGELPEPAPA